MQRTFGELVAQIAQRPQPARHGEHRGQYRQHAQRDDDRQRRDQRLIAHLALLDLRFGNPDLAGMIVAARHLEHANAHVLRAQPRHGEAAPARRLADVDGGQRLVAGDDLAIGADDDEIDRVELVGAQRTLGLRVHFQPQPAVIQAQQLRQGHGDVAQLLVELELGGFDDEPVLQRAEQRHDDQHRHQQPDQQLASQARFCAPAAVRGVVAIAACAIACRSLGDGPGIERVAPVRFRHCRIRLRPGIQSRGSSGS